MTDRRGSPARLGRDTVIAGAQIQSLVGVLRSHKPHSAAKKVLNNQFFLMIDRRECPGRSSG